MDYTGLSESELYAMFVTENWKGLSASERLAACQEVENRFAISRNTIPLKLQSEEMMNRAYGYQLGNRIAINSYLLNDSVFQVEIRDENGEIFAVEEVDVDAPGWNVLDTIFHEGTHGIQLQEGRGAGARAYFRPEDDYDLYRIQPDEKEAYENGQINTLAAIQMVMNEQNIADPDMQLYYESVLQDSYQESLQRAMINYADPEIEKHIAEVVNNRNKYIEVDNPSREYEQLVDVLETRNYRKVDISSPEQNVEEAIQVGFEAPEVDVEQNVEQSRGMRL